jgi:DNA-directed RNA polymerase specialized sigma24 family protein
VTSPYRRPAGPPIGPPLRPPLRPPGRPPHRANHPAGPTAGTHAAATISGIDAHSAGSVQQALSSLSPEHRAVLSEIYRGRSVSDTAKMLGLRESTVKSRVHFALQSLRLALEERGLAPPIPAYTADYGRPTRR